MTESTFESLCGAAAVVGAVVLVAFLAISSAKAATPGDLSGATRGTMASEYPLETVKTCRVTIGASATAIACASGALANPRVRIAKNCGTADTDFGNSAVTSTTGFTLKPGDWINIRPTFSGEQGTVPVVYAAGATTICLFEAN